MKNALFALASTTSLVAYDPGTAGWKLDDDGKIVVENGNPVYVNTKGEESTVGYETISKLNHEAQNLREAKEKAEKELSALQTKFKGIDPEKTKDALEKLAKIDQKQLIDAGEVDKVKDQIKAEFTEQINAVTGKNDDLQKENDMLRLDMAFSGSEFVKNNIAVPMSMFRKEFQDRFKIEGGKAVPLSADGSPLMSKKHVGEVANFDEAIAMMVDAREDRDRILVADDQGGTGNQGGGNTFAGKKTVRRTEYENMSPAAQSEAAAKMRKGELAIVD